MKTIEFFWDVGSPYAYLASTQIDRLRRASGLTVCFRPFLLGGVFRDSGNTMPASVPAKARYMMQDLARWRDHYGVPLKMPGTEVSFPINTLHAMRVATAACEQGQETGEVFCHAIYAAYWGQGRNVSEEGVILAAAKNAKLDGERLLERAKDPAIKEALKTTTAEAVSRGAFGAPSFFVGETLYWGHDRMELLASRERLERCA